MKRKANSFPKHKIVFNKKCCIDKPESVKWQQQSDPAVSPGVINPTIPIF